MCRKQSAWTRTHRVFEKKLVIVYLEERVLPNRTHSYRCCLSRFLLMENEIDDGLFWLPTEFLNDNDGDVEFKSVRQPTFGVFGSWFALDKAKVLRPLWKSWAPKDPTKVEEDSESLEPYQWNIDKKCAPIAVEKGKEKLEHFGIKLEEEEDCKEQQSTYYGKEQSQITCHRCQNFRHYAFECPNKNRKKDQVKQWSLQVMVIKPFEDLIKSPPVNVPTLAYYGIILDQSAFEGDRCTLEYMFKNQQGQNMDVDKMRQRRNDYLDDYFESLDKEKTDREEEMPRFVEDTNTSEVHTFYEFVAFLNLIKNDAIISKSWDIYSGRFDKVLKWFYNHYLKRPLPGTIPPIIHKVLIHLFDLYKLMDCMGGYLSVQFGQEFAREPEDPTKVEEDSESFEPYQWNIDKKCAPIAMEKGKEKLEHFGIKLEEEEDCKEQQSAYYGKEQSQITCYRSQNFRHYAFECPNKNRKKDQVKYSSYQKPSTSKISERGDSHNTSSDEFIIIT
nr:ARID DNA-binding domain-containing protein [Tanacetum cinerariifolium]